MAIPHEHRADLEATLDFINTLELCTTRGHGHHPGEPHEALDSPDAAMAFLAERGLAHRPDLEQAAGTDPRARVRFLDRIRRARAAIREVFDAETEGRAAAQDAVDRVNHILRHRPLVELTPGTDGCGVGHRHVGEPTAEALARLAEPLVEAIAEHRTDRFRICANDECRYVFLDESRTGRRRWCDMATCGNRAKVARHRERARAGSAGDGSG